MPAITVDDATALPRLPEARGSSVVRPVRLRIASAAAPAELGFAFDVSDEQLVLAGPACLVA